MPDEPDDLSPLAAEMVAGLAGFRDALEAGEPVAERFRVADVCVTGGGDRGPYTLTISGLREEDLDGVIGAILAATGQQVLVGPEGAGDGDD